jgi:hypothetical protein
MYFWKRIFTSNDQSDQLSFAERQVISDAKRLLKAIQQSSGQSRLIAVQDLAKLCDRPEKLEILCLNEDLSLLVSLKQLLVTIDDDNNCLSWITSCINMLSVGDASCVAAITTKELALLPVLMNMLRSSSDEDMIVRIEISVSNCSIFEDCHDYLLSSEIGWLDYIERRLKEKSSDKRSYWWFVKFVSNMSNENILVLINRKIPEIILQKMISYGSDEKKWSNEEGEVMNKALSFVMYFSKSTNGSCYLNDYFSLHSQFTSFFFDLLPSSYTTTVRSMIIIANVFWRDETNERTKALLSSHPDILPLLFDIMDAIMNWDVNREEIKVLIKKGFRYGFRLSVVAVALRNLSISDENKKTMINYPKLISLACQGIRLFIDDAPECKGMNPGNAFYSYGGGGGKDLIAVENLLELLLQLYFMFEDETSLRSAFITSSYNLKTLTEELLSLPDGRNISIEIRHIAQELSGSFKNLTRV